ncbi:electron transport complex subunit RsxC [Denitromonas iodatirespirans]|uniref:Ion-translocating oxidoreductase complex subunit C n=1 Tax=Denitromonas iodatirespirans TaxID=2795389 RepID=A0A944H6U9_DENI1|nr:electron transport complex subunit RsxC [Denitromonas iodatirespirans]MBT0960534.1 electron transport complex subunit RsxC [Denitromonas iodatirespirans]
MRLTRLLKPFSGRDWGIHPDDHKRPAADAPLRVMPLPARLYLPVQQHLGGAARPTVVVGQKVRKGERIADAQGMVSAPIHAPTSGTVVAVTDITAPHPSGLSLPAIVIEADGDDVWGTLSPCPRPFELAPQTISERVYAAGIVGMGGAAFPAAVKLDGAARARVDTLVINGGECEPYLSCDDRQMRDFADEVVEGIRLMLRATGATSALVGIEDNKPEAIAAMRTAAAGHDCVRIRPVPARYPMGSEKQLVQVLTGVEVPAEGLPADIGVVVHNVGTARAVRAAVVEGKPLVSRLVTLNGNCMNAPGNVEVRLGTLAEDVIAFAGGLKGDGLGLARRVLGGPMMGLQVPHWRVPVVKGTSGILALDADEAAARQSHPCIRCGRCVQACPMGLLPLEMSARIRNDALTDAVDLGLKDCIACGCCAYVCPSRIPLVQYFVHAKGELSRQDRNRLRNEATKRLAQQRTDRLAREAREKAEAAARRRAEREAKAAAKTDTATAGESA